MMNKPTIILPDGTPVLDLDNVRPEIFGYRIVHVITGRILPGTTRNEIYSKAAAIRKMNRVATMFNIMQCPLDIWDYALSEVYDFEKPKEYKYIVDKNDNIL
jgi:hypothetical protein